MKTKLLPVLLLLVSWVNGQTLVYHDIQKDAHGNLMPWYNPNHGLSYDYCLHSIWSFWDNIPLTNGFKNYMTDHSYTGETAAANKVGGDQFAMALSSWALYYAYSGNQDVVENMKYIADHYLANSLSSSSAVWANLPYPCNFSATSLPVYDGDFILGTGVTQPDKAGSFGNELITLYKITKDTLYLNAAVKIANTLAANVREGDSSNSPYPFKVYAETGNAVNTFAGGNYTSNFVPILLMYENLKKLNIGNVEDYDSATTTILRWLKHYPLQSNNWGCFFEDIPIYSNTETNAVTMAWYILNHPDIWGNTWQQDARGILDWTLSALGSDAYDTLGVMAIYEQSSDLKEGGSHTSRFASVEMIYAEKTGDTSRIAQAVRQLDWSTYLVDFDGKCRFSPREGSIWYTDGYGDFVRHFLRAMAANPSIATDSANHMLGSSSVITDITYDNAVCGNIYYHTFDTSSEEVLRLISKPQGVYVNGSYVTEQDSLNADGWEWKPYDVGGVLKVKHSTDNYVAVIYCAAGIEDLNEKLFQVFPNPASDILDAKLPEKADNFSIFNVAGGKMQTINCSGKAEITLSVSELPSGIYFVNVTGRGFSLNRKIVIVR